MQVNFAGLPIVKMFLGPGGDPDTECLRGQALLYVELLEHMLQEVLEQATWDAEKCRYDSAGLSAYEDAIELLVKAGRLMLLPGGRVMALRPAGG